MCLFGKGKHRTDETFISFKKKNEIMIVGISDSQCETCCQTEGILADFMALGLTHKGKVIPILRIDISTKSSNAILKKEDIHFDSVPRIILVR